MDIVVPSNLRQVLFQTFKSENKENDIARLKAYLCQNMTLFVCDTQFEFFNKHVQFEGL